ncbi:MAG TPA: DUF1634 domain-containing protein [Candidatus Methylomirabilis sp.]|nr:DUF1634 domain-containing protein [Candidatus Methylomirabilis sp.]
MTARAHTAARAAVDVEQVISRVLLGGGLLSIALVVIGLALYASHTGLRDRPLEVHRMERPGRQGHPPEVFVSLAEVAAGLRSRPVEPLAVIALGLALLLMTPVLGVAVAIPSFLAAGDRRYAGIAAVVLAMLVLSMLITGGLG